MADEISLQASISFSTTNIDENINPASLQIDVASALGDGGVQQIGSGSHETIVATDTGDGGIFFFRNIDDAINITIGRVDGGSFNPFLKLLPGEYAVGRLQQSAIAAQAASGTANLQYRLFSP